MSTPEPDAAPEIVSHWPLAQAVVDTITTWLPEYLAAWERQNAREPGKLPQLRSATVRHTALLRATEQTPALIVAIEGAGERAIDPDGTETAPVELEVTVVASSKDLTTTGELLHVYGACVRQLLRDHPTAGGLAGNGLVCVDEDYTGIAELREGTLQMANLAYVAAGVVTGKWGDGPIGGPREDPVPPWPQLPTVETTHAAVYPIDPEDV